MEQIVLLAIQAVEALLPELEHIASPEIGRVILLLEKALPFAASLGEDLLQPILNIIEALQGNGNVTPEQIASLDAQMTLAEAELDAAAQADKLAGA